MNNHHSVSKVVGIHLKHIEPIKIRKVQVRNLKTSASTKNMPDHADSSAMSQKYTKELFSLTNSLQIDSFAFSQTLSLNQDPFERIQEKSESENDDSLILELNSLLTSEVPRKKTKKTKENLIGPYVPMSKTVKKDKIIIKTDRKIIRAASQKHL